MNDPKSSKELRRTLLLEVHRLIARAAQQTIDALAKGVSEQTVCYPPNPTITQEEMAALNVLELSPIQRSALAKLVSDSTASAFFHFMCLIDGVGDPEVTEVDKWVGARIRPPIDGEDEDDMWHDDLFDSYWEYAEALDRSSRDGE